MFGPRDKEKVVLKILILIIISNMKILSNINKTNFIGKIKEMPFNKKITIKKIILTDLIPTIEEV